MTQALSTPNRIHLYNTIAQDFSNYYPLVGGTGVQVTALHPLPLLYGRDDSVLVLPTTCPGNGMSGGSHPPARATHLPSTRGMSLRAVSADHPNMGDEEEQL